MARVISAIAQQTAAADCLQRPLVPRFRYPPRLTRGVSQPFGLDEPSMRKENPLLAYVFWHWKQAAITATDYENRQRTFHAALAAAPSAGFLESFSMRLSHAPWAAGGGDAYEDWYLVQDFGALGLLNEAAVSASRVAPHDAAAAGAAGGAGGLYRLQHGAALRQPQVAYWFGKPEGMPYRDLFAQLAPVVTQVQGALWMRQMVLGPALEFCLHATAPVSMPTVCSALVIPLRQAWSELANNALQPPASSVRCAPASGSG